MKRKTLVLINPANQLRPGFHINRKTRNQPLGLGIIAALTPSDWKIKILDENFKTFRFYEADLMGITAFTSQAPRAYEIAAIYRQRGIPTVMGGIHASMVPEESMQYVDCVVQGEAEPVWETVIRDFEAGNLKRIYKSPLVREILQPKPRRDLFHPGYICAGIQTTRGCPMNCSFCSVSAFNGRHYRFRPVEEVLDELEEIPQKYVFFIDDNIIGHNNESKERARVLFEGILRRGIKKIWLSQSSINFADDPILLDLAYRSGCRMIFLGIEAEGEGQLIEANKKLNLTRGVNSYKRIFEAIQHHGIGVIAGLIFGWDSDTSASIRDRARFAMHCGADSFQTSVLTPLPGTALWDKVTADKRLLFSDFPGDWAHYDYFEPTIRHPEMTSEALMLHIEKAKRKIFSPFRIATGALKTLIRTRSMSATIMLTLNYRHYRNIFLKGNHG
ncbi:MAG: B12-binding domain-containing radical SAM protein [Alphaproteobacteria bacterium]|nr:B12-binding domain-containing radical SAM protein [Alphaproteobacteria bacterium]